jgi:hypothetical protein
MQQGTLHQIKNRAYFGNNSGDRTNYISTGHFTGLKSHLAVSRCATECAYQYFITALVRLVPPDPVRVM